MHHFNLCHYLHFYARQMPSLHLHVLLVVSTRQPTSTIFLLLTFLQLQSEQALNCTRNGDRDLIQDQIANTTDEAVAVVVMMMISLVEVLTMDLKGELDEVNLLAYFVTMASYHCSGY